MLPEIPCFQNYCLYSCLLPPVSKINPKNYCLNSFTPLLPNSHKATGFIWRATKALPAAAAGRQARHHGRPLRHGTKKAEVEQRHTPMLHFGSQPERPRLRPTDCYFPWCSSETVSFLRPLARREASTRRPFFVDILSRKPCLFTLLLL